MKCIYCGQSNSKVVDSRPIEDGSTVRRRRQCVACKRRFTTYERSVMPPILVVKRDGARQLFELDKVRMSIVHACEHRDVDPEAIEESVSRVDQQVRDSDAEEVKAEEIGAMVMRELLRLDKIAYIRFASVYERFTDADQFVDLVHQLAHTAEGKKSE